MYRYTNNDCYAALFAEEWEPSTKDAEKSIASSFLRQTISD